MCVGTCALCLTQHVQLQQSHILSKFVYRHLRDPSGSNPNPMHIQHGKAVQTSSQITEYLLCHSCEQSLGNGCESYVSQIAYQFNGDCPLYNLLGYTSSISDVKRPAPRHVVPCDSLNIQHLLDFAVSIFWRSAISTHTSTQSFSLNSSVSEQLRSYLRNHGNELDGMPIVLIVLDQPRGLSANRFDRSIMVPATGDYGSYRVHSFLFNGLYFRMAEGTKIPPKFFTLSIYHNIPRHLTFSVAANLSVFRSILRLVNTVP